MAGDSNGLRIPFGWALAVIVTLLVFVNVIDVRVAHASLVVGPASAAGLLALARRAGLSWQDLGLATDNEAVRSTVGTGASGKALSVLATVLFTGLSGVVFCELRRRSGSWLARTLIPWRPPPRIRRTAAWALAAAAVVLIPLFGVLGARWQHQVRELTGADQPSEARYVFVVLVSIVVATALLGAARAFWWAVRRVARLLGRFLPTTAQISAFTGEPAREPIRIYVGLKSAPSIPAESALAVRELDRTGAFDRKVLVVVTTTGTGWVNAEMVDPVEYMYDGDTAVAAIQYSYLPSWLSFLADKGPAQEAGRDLFNAVYDRWQQLPAGHRPKLVVLGESLGSFGGEAAFSGAEDIRARASGVLWVGPTNSNELWDRFVSARDPGTPEWRPVYQDGQTVRFATGPADLDASTPAWPRPRAVYLQNASDPIVWWSPRLAFRVPGWLQGPRGPGVSPSLHWYPLVTFWQVTADMADSTSVPPGAGHVYSTLEGTSAWASIIPPPGWTPERTVALARQLAG